MSDIPILYEDNWLAVVDKPAGLLTVPTPRKERRTLSSVVNDQLRRDPASLRLYPCHRLDRETSGVIVYAKGEEARDRMMQLFRSRKVRKTYLAIVQGTLSGHGRIAVPVEGQHALTRYHAIESRRRFSFLKVFPETGRTNQIRIHFRNIGHPLVGESTFAFRKDFALKAKRTLLHAAAIEFFHPVTARPVRVESGLPGDMSDFLETHSKEQ